MTDKTKTENRVLSRIREFVTLERRHCDENARGTLHNLEEALVPEAQVGHAQTYADENARGVETCDAVMRKLDEVEGEL